MVTLAFKFGNDSCYYLFQSVTWIGIITSIVTLGITGLCTPLLSIKGLITLASVLAVLAVVEGSGARLALALGATSTVAPAVRASPITGGPGAVHVATASTVVAPLSGGARVAIILIAAITIAALVTATVIAAWL